MPIPQPRALRIPSHLAALACEISRLHLDTNNANTHPVRNLEAIKASLTRFGQQRPILASRDGTIIAGNGTYSAATELGWTHIAVVTTALTGQEATAYAIADNRTAELASWDIEALTRGLSDMDEALRLAAGFTEVERLALTHATAEEISGQQSQGDAQPVRVFQIVIEFSTEDEQQEGYSRICSLGYRARVHTV